MSDTIVVPGVTLWNEKKKEEYMSARNTLTNKAIRRAEREDRKARFAKKQALNARMQYLAYAPPATFEELEEEVNRITDEANQEN